jgi:hypothetical protein
VLSAVKNLVANDPALAQCVETAAAEVINRAKLHQPHLEKVVGLKGLVFAQLMLYTGNFRDRVQDLEASLRRLNQ